MPRKPTTSRKKPAPPPRPRGRPPLREQARSVYRDGILEAAAEVLIARGYAGTRMQDVAARAGLSTGTLYNHFDSKAELTVCLLEHRAQDLVARIDAMLAESARTAGSVIEGLVGITLDHLDRQRALFNLLEQGMEGADLGPSASRCHRVRVIYMGAVMTALEAAAARGELRPGLAPADLAMLLGGMVHGLGKALMADGGPPLVDRAPLVVDVFLHGAGRTR